MKAENFLKEMFRIAPGREVLFRAIPPGKAITTETGNIKLPKITKDANWYFGVCPREDEENNQKPKVGVTVWSDIDGVDEFPKLVRKVAPPSAIVNTGHGVHVYYFFDDLQSIQDTVKLVKLAQLCLNGDKQATDPTRLLRIPGSMNIKRKPHMPCELIDATLNRYDLKKIEEMMMSALLVENWESGLRNQITLGFAALMARAGWEVDRACKVIKSVCVATKDEDQRNRLLTTRNTYAKHHAGEIITFKEFADILGSKFKQLTTILGYDTQDGEVKYEDQVIGTYQTIQQDLVNLLIGDHCKWAWSEGQLVTWNGKAWIPQETKSLTSDVFRVMDKLTVVKGSIEKKLPAKPGVAEGISRIMIGNFASKPLEPHDPDVIGLSNGALHLVTGEFRPSVKEDRLKRLLPVEYDENAKCPSWLRFLDEAAPAEAQFLQEWVGYCLRPGNHFQRMLWVYGPSNTGKSTFLVVVYSMFGPTAVTLSSQNISQYQIAGLADAYLAVCTELTAQKFRTGAFKSLVSGDPVMARHPYGRPFGVEFRGKIMWGSNSLPTLDEAAGMWRRLVIIPFDNLPKKLDTGLIPRLKAEEMSGIFNWAVEGYHRVREYAKIGAWAIPDRSSEAVANYMQYADLVDVFIQEEMERGEKFKVGLREVFTRYLEFIKEMGHQTQEFGAWFIEEFKRRNYVIEDGMTLCGIKMKNLNSLAWGVDERRAR